jgi:RNA polymerase primary sigma factor
MKELKISQRITTRDSDLIDKYFHEVNLLPLLTIEDEIVLSKKIQEGDEIALTKFVEGNLRFVISVAKQYQNLGEPLQDLISSGNEGVIKAVKRFDHTRGFKFISYGVFWIRQAILKHLADNARIIKLPGHKISILNQIKKLNQVLEQNLERNPTSEELRDLFIENSIKKGKKSSIKESEIESLFIANKKVNSLDKPFDDNSEFSLNDITASESNSDYIQETDTKNLQETLKTIFSQQLTPCESLVVSMNFGLFGHQAMNLEEIGEKLELKRERIRQIREKAIRKLKHKSVVKYIVF